MPGLPKSITPALSADAARFAAAIEDVNGNTEVKVWNQAGAVLFTGKDRALPGRTHSKRTVKLSDNGSRLAYAAFDSLSTPGQQRKETCRLRVWDTVNGGEMLSREASEGVFIPGDFSRDGRLLATTWVRNASTSSRGTALDFGLGPGCREGTAASRSLFPVRNRGFQPRRTAACVEPFTRRERTGNWRASICETTTGNVLMTRTWPQAQLGRPAYSSDGRLLALSVTDGPEPGGVKVLDATTGAELHLLAGHRYPIEQLVFSADGRRLASLASFTGLTEAEVKLWDPASGRELLTLPATGQGDLAFSPDSHHLVYFSTIDTPAARGQRGTRIQIWDATPLPDEGPAASAPWR